MADAMDSKSIVRKGVWVRLPPRPVGSSQAQRANASAVGPPREIGGVKGERCHSDETCNRYGYTFCSKHAPIPGGPKNHSAQGIWVKGLTNCSRDQPRLARSARQPKSQIVGQTGGVHVHLFWLTLKRSETLCLAQLRPTGACAGNAGCARFSGPIAAGCRRSACPPLPPG